jgi:hypothetical protein
VAERRGLEPDGGCADHNVDRQFGDPRLPAGYRLGRPNGGRNGYHLRAPCAVGPVGSRDANADVLVEAPSARQAAKGAVQQGRAQIRAGHRRTEPRPRHRLNRRSVCPARTSRAAANRVGHTMPIENDSGT